MVRVWLSVLSDTLPARVGDAGQSARRFRPDRRKLSIRGGSGRRGSMAAGSPAPLALSTQRPGFPVGDDAR